MSNKKPQSDVGFRLREARSALSLTQATFSEPLGVKQSHISGIEKGERDPSETLLILMEYHYRINKEWVRGGQGEMFLSQPKEEELLPEHKTLIAAYEKSKEPVKRAILTILENLKE